MMPLKTLLLRPNPLFWTLQTCGWLGYFALNFTAAMGDGKPWHYIYFSFTVAAMGFLLTSVLRLCYRRIWHLPASRMVLAAAGMLLIAAAIDAKLYAEVVFHFCLDCRPSNVLGYIWYFASMLYVLMSWSGLYFGFKFSRQLQQQKEAALQAQAMAHEAQLKMLRYQLNPHFLFNTLNAISTLVLDDRRETANLMVGSLSAFLRYSLDSDPVQRVSLAQEIEALNLYLTIEQLRFGDRLRVHIDIADDVRAALVPSLILQPLIENAVKHAISKREEGGQVELTACRDGGYLDIHMRDDGPGCPQPPTAPGEGHGVGLVNTRERLRVLFGTAQQLTIGNRVPHGADVHMRLPFETAAAKEV